jgi:hypothetical protein
LLTPKSKYKGEIIVRRHGTLTRRKRDNYQSSIIYD